MKKLISLVVVVVLIMAMTVPALAALPEVVEPQACTHPSRILITTSYNKIRYYDENYCMRCNEHAYRCDNSSCYAVFTVPEWIAGTKVAHKRNILSASCNGTTQTWSCYCENCITYYTKRVTCPGLHSGSACNFLPV